MYVLHPNILLFARNKYLTAFQAFNVRGIHSTDLCKNVHVVLKTYGTCRTTDPIPEGVEGLLFPPLPRYEMASIQNVHKGSP